MLFYFIRVKLNSVHPKDAMGPVFAHPTKVLCVYMHELCVNTLDYTMLIITIIPCVVKFGIPSTSY